MNKASGKWKVTGVPQKGWQCVSTYDSCEDGDDLHKTCEMCEEQAIRYVHVMTHPNYPGELECGCICAGRMEEDYAAADRREKDMRLRASRRARFPKRKGWKRSPKGNLHIKVDGHHLVVGHRRGGYAIGAKPRWRDERKWGRVYPTEYAAQRAAFDAVEWCEANAGRPPAWG